MRILIIRTDHLGDAILTTPLIRALAKAGHEVDLIVRDPFLSFFADNPFLRACHGLDTLCPDLKTGWRGLGAWIRGENYDVTVILFAWPKEILFASLVSGVPRRIALHSHFWGRLTLHECPTLRLKKGNRPFPEALLDIADLLGAPRDGIGIDLQGSPSADAWAGQALKERFGNSPIVGLHLGTGGSACNPSPRAYEAMAAQIVAETDWSLVITGTAGELRLLAEWDRSLLASPRLWNSMGELSLPELGGVIRKMDLYICPSTGPLHIAGAFCVPTLTPFCTVPCMSPTMWAPRTGEGHVLTAEADRCRDFSLRKRNFCDFAGKISPVQIVEEAKRILGAARPTERRLP